MNRSEAQTYFRTLAKDYKVGAFRTPATPEDSAMRKDILAVESTSDTFGQAKDLLRSQAQEKHADRLLGNGRPIPKRIDWEERKAKIAPKQTETEVPSPARVERENKVKTTEDILWAHQALKTYAELPEGKVRKNAFEAFAKDHFVDLWKDPSKLKTALEVWKAQSEESRLFSSAKERVNKEVKMHWRDVSEEQLTEYVKINARGGYVEKEIGDVLKSYFAGPRTREDRVDNYYKFASAALDLSEDTESLKRAAEIGLFQTELLPLRDDYSFDIYVASSMCFYNPEMKAKATIARSNIVASLGRFVGLDYDAILLENYEGLEVMLGNEKYKHALRQARNRSQRENPAALRKALQSNAFQKNVQHGPRTTSDVYADTRRGEYSEDDLVEAMKLNAGEGWENDPLIQKYTSKIESRAAYAIQKQWAKAQIAESGETATFITIRVPEKGCAIEIAMPASLNAHRREIIAEYFGPDFLGNADLTRRLVDDGRDEPMYEDLFHFNGKKIFSTIRRQDEAEGERHVIENLNGFGFPEVTVENLGVTNSELATKIELEQRRFMNERGIRIPFRHKALTELGYQHIDFRKDPADPEKTSVKIYVSGMDVEFKMDRDFRFDFEGKYADISGIQDSLHNVLLDLLYPALCKESVKDQDGQELEISKTMISRVGHLRLLPEGQGYSQDQVNAMLDFEGRDLHTISERRKIELDTTRNTTYVRPKFADDPTQPPVTLYIGIPEDKFIVRTQEESIIDRAKATLTEGQEEPSMVETLEEARLIWLDKKAYLTGLERAHAQLIADRDAQPEFSRRREDLDKRIAREWKDILKLSGERAKMENEMREILDASIEDAIAEDPRVGEQIGDKELTLDEKFQLIIRVVEGYEVEARQGVEMQEAVSEEELVTDIFVSRDDSTDGGPGGAGRSDVWPGQGAPQFHDERLEEGARFRDEIDGR